MNAKKNRIGGKILFSALMAILLVVPAAADSAPTLGPSNPRLEEPVYENDDAVCYAEFSDPDSNDNEGELKFAWETNGINYENKTFTATEGTIIQSYYDSSYFEDGNEVVCRVYSTDDVGESDEQTTTDFDNQRVQSSIPNVTDGPNFQNYSSEHAFNVSAIVEDEEGTSDIDSCRLEVTEPGGNSMSTYMSIDEGFGDEDMARCFYSNVSDRLPGFEVLEDIETRVTVNDTSGDSNYTESFNPIPNSFPTVYNIQPEDDSRTASGEIELSIDVVDNDGEKVNVSFYNTTSGVEKLHEEKNVDGGTVSYLWGQSESLESLKTYYWVVNASDGHSTTTVPLNFRNLISSRYRVQTDIEHRYSSVLTAVENQKVLNFRVENNAGTSKSLTSEIKGTADAEFVRFGNSHSYNLDSDEAKNFRIEVSASEEKTALDVVTTNNDYDISTESSIEVYPRNAVATAPEVPGIGLLNILVLVFFSTLYYSVRL